MTGEQYTQQLKAAIIDRGAAKVGITSIDSLRGVAVSPGDLLDRFRCAIAIAVQIPTAVFDMITDQPTPIYSRACETANRLLDDIAFRTALSLQRDGFQSIPIPASQVIIGNDGMGR